MAAIGHYELTVEVSLQAKPKRVWTLLTTGIGRWWPKQYFALESSKSFVCDSKLGGRVYEQGANGAGGIWGTIIVWLPGRKMTWACEMYPGWGGPGRSFVTWEVIPQPKGCLLRLHDAGLCPDAAKARASLESGWTELIRTYLKPFAEAKPRR